MQLEGKIEYCESRINVIVYQLYELTEDAIGSIKGIAESSMPDLKQIGEADNILELEG